MESIKNACTSQQPLVLDGSGKGKKLLVFHFCLCLPWGDLHSLPVLVMAVTGIANRVTAKNKVFLKRS